MSETLSVFFFSAISWWQHGTVAFLFEGIITKNYFLKSLMIKECKRRCSFLWYICISHCEVFLPKVTTQPPDTVVYSCMRPLKKGRITQKKETWKLTMSSNIPMRGQLYNDVFKKNKWDNPPSCTPRYFYDW